MALQVQSKKRNWFYVWLHLLTFLALMTVLSLIVNPQKYLTAHCPALGIQVEAAQKKTTRENTRNETTHKKAPSISSKTLSLLKGEKAQLSVRNPGGGTVWTSSNVRVADVSWTGLVTAHRKGTCTITARVGKKRLRCRVSVCLNPGRVDSSTVLRGIDVSYWQGNINFRKVKQAGIQFVIIRAGHGWETDKYFDRNYRKAKAAGLKVGGYWFSTALTMKQAAGQRNLCLKKIRGKKFDFPVFIDIEYQPQLNKGKAFTSVVLQDFCQAMKKAGIKPGFYIEHRYIGPYLSPEMAQGCGYFQWVREISMTNHYKSSYNMWQQSIGRINGISGPVDLNYYFPAEKNGVG